MNELENLVRLLRHGKKRSEPDGKTILRNYMEGALKND